MAWFFILFYFVVHLFVAFFSSFFHISNLWVICHKTSTRTPCFKNNNKDQFIFPFGNRNHFSFVWNVQLASNYWTMFSPPNKFIITFLLMLLLLLTRWWWWCDSSFSLLARHFVSILYMHNQQSTYYIVVVFAMEICVFQWKIARTWHKINYTHFSQVTYNLPELDIFIYILLWYRLILIQCSILTKLNTQLLITTTRLCDRKKKSYSCTKFLHFVRFFVIWKKKLDFLFLDSSNLYHSICVLSG